MSFLLHQVNDIKARADGCNEKHLNNTLKTFVHLNLSYLNLYLFFEAFIDLLN